MFLNHLSLSPNDFTRGNRDLYWFDGQWFHTNSIFSLQEMTGKYSMVILGNGALDVWDNPAHRNSRLLGSLSELTGWLHCHARVTCDHYFASGAGDLAITCSAWEEAWKWGFYCWIILGILVYGQFVVQYCSL